MKAIVHLLPTPQDLSEAAGRQLTQALGALGGGAFPGAKIPVEISPESERGAIEFEGAVRSENDEAAVRFFDKDGNERGVVPLHRIDYVEFTS